MQTNASFDYEAQNSYSIRLRSTDQGGLWFEEIFTISINDLEEIPPTVLTTSFETTGVVNEGATTLTVTFSEPVLDANIPSNYQLRRAGADALLRDSDSILNPSSVVMDGNVATLTFSAFVEDIYRLTILDTVTDFVGNTLDGDSDSVNSGNFRGDFVVTSSVGQLDHSLFPLHGFHRKIAICRSVAVDGDLRVVGAPNADINGPNLNDGAFTFLSAITETLIATLANPNAGSNQNFGFSVAISGNTVVVGAPNYSAAIGRAYIFNATTGALIATLVNPSPTLGEEFGCSVAISGNTIIVGARKDNVTRGSAYIFNATTGTLIATLANPTPSKATNLLQRRHFGRHDRRCAVLDDAVAIDSGIAYIFNANTGALIATWPIRHQRMETIRLQRRRFAQHGRRRGGF